jgi:hypothetical protein
VLQQVAAAAAAANCLPAAAAAVAFVQAAWEPTKLLT